MPDLSLPSAAQRTFEWDPLGNLVAGDRSTIFSETGSTPSLKNQSALRSYAGSPHPIKLQNYSEQPCG